MSASALSAICLSSASTNAGTTIVPSIMPVLHMSAILPSIITDVSSILGLATLLLLSFPVRLNQVGMFISPLLFSTIAQPR